MTLTITAAVAACPPAMPSPAPSSSGRAFAQQLEVAGARAHESPASESSRAPARDADSARAPEHDAEDEPVAIATNAATAAAKEDASAPAKRAATTPRPIQPARVTRGRDDTADSSDTASPPINAGAADPEPSATPEARSRTASRPKNAGPACDADAPPAELCAWIHRMPAESPAAEVARSTPLRATHAPKGPAEAADSAQNLASLPQATAPDSAATMGFALPGLANEQAGANHQFAEASTSSPNAIGAIEMARANATVTQASEAGRAPLLQAELAAAPGTPHFPAALGAQLSTWMRDGVQQARLHLNPADLGPIGVRISLDGTNAQIDFQAAHAATRAALEAAVPSLASALHQSGFTLSGGGVFQQPPHSRPSSDADARGSGQGHAGQGSAPDGDEMPVTSQLSTRSIAHRGIVDLYA